MNDTEREAMIDKMAAEICYACFAGLSADYGGPKEYWKGVVEAQKEAYRREARAALSVAIPIIRGHALEEAVKVVEGFEKNRDWVPGSLYDTLRREVAAAVRKLSEAE